MATEGDVPKRQITPVPVPVIPSCLPQKRTLEDDHAPPISSPLNPNPDMTAMARDKPARTKKEPPKKRDFKAGGGAGGTGTGGDSSRATPDPRTKEAVPSEFSPLRYKLAPPKPSDFEPARGPVFTYHHESPAPDGSVIKYYETSEQ